MATKNDLIKQEENNFVSLVDQTGVENAIEKLVIKNNSLLPENVIIDRIKNSAGFYISNREDLMKLPSKEKMQMLYGVLQEAMVGCEAGTDYDIVPFKAKPVIVRKKNGWFKIVDLIKPAEIVRFTNNVVFKGDEFSFNPVTEDLKHIPKVTSDKYEDIEYAYAYIRFANGFEKTVVMSKKDLDNLKKISPSGNTSFSPWNSIPVKMVKTKVVKELAKELCVLYGGRLNSALYNAIDNDEVVVDNVNEKGFIKTDKTLYKEATYTEKDEPVVVENIDEL